MRVRNARAGHAGSRGLPKPRSGVKSRVCGKRRPRQPQPVRFHAPTARALLPISVKVLHVKNLLSVCSSPRPLVAGNASAQPVPNTLGKIKAAKAINVAFSGDSLPFSFVGPEQRARRLLDRHLQARDRADRPRRRRAEPQGELDGRHGVRASADGRDAARPTSNARTRRRRSRGSRTSTSRT